MLQCKCLDPDNQGEPPASCGQEEYKGDGNCDDENNNKGCAYDGGDCCAKSVKGGKVRKDYCKKVRLRPTVVISCLFISSLFSCVGTNTMRSSLHE